MRGRASRLRPAALAAILAVLLIGCAEQDARPNVVLISIDTLRADAIGAYGGASATPVMDRLAREGVTFEMALAPSALTAPSHASLFTGLGPLQHGLLKNGEEITGPVPTLAERFRERGYATGGFVSSFVLDGRFGWSRGFEAWDATFPESEATLPKELGTPGQFFHKYRFDGFDRRAPATTRAALEWLADAPEPYFLFVHYFDPHDPYVPPDAYYQALKSTHFDVEGRSAPEAMKPHRLERLIRRYHAEVSFTDASLGELMAGIAARSARARLTVITADHGEGLGQHGWLLHARHLHDELLHVPLLVHASGIEIARGQRIQTPVGLIDVAPTIAELAGLPEQAVTGVSLARSVRDGSEPAARALFAHRRAYPTNTPDQRGEHHAVRDGSWKLIRREGVRSELYDLAHDPGELHDLAPLEPERVARLAVELARDRSGAAPDRRARELSDEERAALEALGYTE